MKFHHSGIATTDLDRSAETLKREWGAVPISEVVLDPEQHVRVMLLDIAGQVVELVEDHGKGPVAAWLARGVKLYHLCFETPDLDGEIARARGRGAMIASPPKPAALFGGRKVAFLLDPVLGLVELLAGSA